MSLKRTVSFLLAMVILGSVFTVMPAKAAETQVISGCVISGVSNASSEATEEVGETLVTVKESEVPMASAEKLLADQKIEEAKNAKKEKKIAEETKESEKNYEKALRLLAAIVYCEAGGQCYAGRLAVAAVVMNRVESDGYPNTIKGVLWQPYQFGPIRQGKMARELKYYDQGLYKYPERKGSLQAAKDILAGIYTVEYNGQTIDLKKYHNFNGHLSDAKIRISGHDFA